MMKNFTITLCSLLVLTCHCLAEPLKSTVVPKTAKWYFHVNMEQLSQGEMGKLMEDFDFLVLFKTGDRSALQYFTNENGDLSGSITGYGVSEQPKEGVLRASGIKDGAKDAVLENLNELEDYKSWEEDSITMHSWSQQCGRPDRAKTKQMYGVFVDDNTFFMAQNIESLQAAIEHQSSGKNGLKVKNSNSAFIGKHDLSGLKVKSAVGTWANSIETQLDVAKDGAIEGNCIISASNDEEANKIVQSLQGMLAFAALSGKFEDWDPTEGMKISQAGSNVTIDMSVPVSTLKALSRK